MSKNEHEISDKSTSAYSVKAAADALGVSKTAVRKWLHNLPEDSYRKDDSGRGMVWITPDGMKLLRERIANQTANQPETDREPIENQPQTVCVELETDRKLSQTNCKQPQTNCKLSQTEPQTIANQSLQSEPETASLLPHFCPTDNIAELLQILREQLAEKDKQIASLTTQNAATIAQNAELLATVRDLTSQLSAAQALHAATVKQLQTATNNAHEETPTNTRTVEPEHSEVNLTNYAHTEEPDQGEPEQTKKPPFWKRLLKLR